MPKGEPTYIIVNANGTVTAIFTGGVQIQENNTGTVSGGGAVTWVASPGTTIYEYINGFFNAIVGHVLALASQGDANNFASLTTISQTGGSAGTAYVSASAQDGVTLVDESVTIIDSEGRSSFLQGGYNGGVPPIFSFPTRALGVAYIPSTKRPTLVIMTISQAAPAGVSQIVTISVGGEQIAQIQSVVAGALSEVQIPVTFFVPAGNAYEAAVTAGVNSAIFSTVEITL